MGTLLFILIVFLSLFLRFYGLHWGNQFFFHPDERNIASSISQLQFPNQMNPHFFAYGSLPIYVIYFTGALLNFLSSIIHNSLFLIHVSFEQAILISRFYSALFSTIVVVMTYLIVKKLADVKAAIQASFLSSTSVGLIQFAHFGTFEMWLALLGLFLFYLCLRITQQGKLLNIILAGITLGLLVATKISSIVLSPIPLVAIVLYTVKQGGNKINLLNAAKRLVIPFFLVLAIALATLATTSPFVVTDFSSFLSTMKYESSVALGTLPVFYTGEFFNTTPIIFQLTHIYPFLLSPLLTALFIPSLIYVTYIGIKKRVPSYFLLFTIYYLLFLSQAFFFAKWTRYMIPTLPFMYMIITIFLSSLFRGVVKRLLGSSIILISILYAFSYFLTVYIKPDTRVAASLWAKENIKADAKILSEVYDLGITPFNQYFPHIALFNFYDLDNPNTSEESWPRELSLPPSEVEKLKILLSRSEQSDYIILSSQRIMKTRLSNEKQFPNGHRFYKSLFSGELGYKKVYQTPCDLFCQIIYLGDPVFNFEETVNVFDRPTVFIFKKM